MKPTLVLWIAQGLGAGRLPLGPGTWGTVVGVGWLALLLFTHSIGWFCGILAASILVAAPLCESAERILRTEDPPSVVLDEIVAVPLCFLPWVALVYSNQGRLPRMGELFDSAHWPLSVTLLVLFRVLDIVKPGPIRRIQSLRNGWGVVADDVLAGAVVAAFLGILWFIKAAI